MKDLNKYKGCLIGGAAGDALGYPVEFMFVDDIFFIFGENGITDYKLTDNIAQISDDTQMTLFTANGLLLGTTDKQYEKHISQAYIDWLRTQDKPFTYMVNDRPSWLLTEKELFARRAPGNTCLSAITQGANGTIEQPLNNSKGCGGIMRIAPIGLYFTDSTLTINEIDMLGANVAALTHGNELGYIPAAAFVHIINVLSKNEDATILSSVTDAMSNMKELFPNARTMAEFQNIMNKAIFLAETDIADTKAIRQIGQGWTADETLAISVYCALKYHDDFEKAIVATVNHSGDSDSTGAVTGNIMGVHLGINNIPKKYIENLELKDVILEIAEDLFHDTYWDDKYEL